MLVRDICLNLPDNILTRLVVVWDDARGRAVAELEFRERVRGLAARRGWLIVVLRRRVVAYTVNESIERWQEWDTNDNQRGMSRLSIR